MIKFHKAHAWAKLDGDVAAIGISDYAQKKLTNIVFIELPRVGETAKQGEQIATVESVKSVSAVISPLSGDVTEINNELMDSPEILNKDPYAKGWMIKIKVKDKKEFDRLLSEEDYKKMFK